MMNKLSIGRYGRIKSGVLDRQDYLHYYSRTKSSFRKLYKASGFKIECEMKGSNYEYIAILST